MSLLLLKPGAPEPTEKLAALEAFMNEQGRTPALVIPALQQAQALFGYVPKEAMALVASSLGVPFARVYGVATFYAQFRLQPAGRRTVPRCPLSAVGGIMKYDGYAGVRAAYSVSRLR